MALLKPSLLFNLARRTVSTSKPLSASWNKDWKPGPYPKTEEERIAAAKKYNLFPEEYKPIPDDGNGAGDYPDFKAYSAEGRDPHYPWDYPEYRRNFNEPVHEDFNLLGFDRINVDERLRFKMWQMLLGFITVVGGFTLVCHLTQDTMFPAAMPRHLPANGAYYKYPSSSSQH